MIRKLLRTTKLAPELANEQRVMSDEVHAIMRCDILAVFFKLQNLYHIAERCTSITSHTRTRSTINTAKSRYSAVIFVYNVYTFLH